MYVPHGEVHFKPSHIEETTKSRKIHGDGHINTSINANHFLFYIFTSLHFYILPFYFLLFIFWTSWSWISCMLEGGPAFFVWAISREIVRITLTTLWLHLINAAWAACLIVITSYTEYLRNCPKFQTGWRLTISHVVSSSYHLAW